MSSSCSNPLLYGWLNQNFRNEFEQIFNALKRCFGRVCLNKQSAVISLAHGRHGGHSTMTLTPNHELIHYQTKNSECTITDYHNNHNNHLFSKPTGKAANRNIVIIEENNNENGSSSNNHAYNKKKKNNNRFFNEPTSGLMNDPNTTQIYLSTTFGPEEESSVLDTTDINQSPKQPPHQSSNQLTVNIRPNRVTSGSRFKRLSLTDSRKRRRKKDHEQNGKEQLSISAIATDQSSIVLMDSKNSSNNSERSNSINSSNETNKHGKIQADEKSHHLSQSLL